MGKNSEPTEICAISRDVGKVVLAPKNTANMSETPKRASAIPTRIIKAVLRIVDRYSNFIRVQKVFNVKPSPRLNLAGRL